MLLLQMVRQNLCLSAYRIRPPIFVVNIPTPGATKSGFIYTLFLVYPLPEKSDTEFKIELYAPTVIALFEVEGRVSVVFMLGIVNAVFLPTSSTVGSHMLNSPRNYFLSCNSKLQKPIHYSSFFSF